MKSNLFVICNVFDLMALALIACVIIPIYTHGYISSAVSALSKYITMKIER